VLILPIETARVDTDMAAPPKAVASPAVRLLLKPATTTTNTTVAVAAAQTTQTAPKPKKKKPLIVNRPPAVKPKNRKPIGCSSVGGKKLMKNADCFPIPLAFLYRDPRPTMGRRLAAAGGGNGVGGVSGISGGASGGGGGVADHWEETDGDGLPIKETAEQLREKKTLYAANMAQAQAFQNNYRFQDAQSALTKVNLINPIFTIYGRRCVKLSR
jgi:hypothetical protein